MNKCAQKILQAMSRKDIEELGIEVSASDAELKQALKIGYEKVKLKKFQARVSAQHTKLVLAEIDDHIAQSKEGTFLQRTFRNISAHEAVNSHLTQSRRMGDQSPRHTNLEMDAHTIKLGWHSKIATLMARYRPKKLGLEKDRKGQALLMRAILGDKISDPDVAVFKDAWNEVVEDIHAEFKAAGGDMGKIEQYAMPQKHDMVRIGRAGEDKWVTDTSPLLDKDKIMGQLKLKTDEEFNEALKAIYKHLAIGGKFLYKKGDTGFKINKMLGNRHQTSRVLHFNSGTDYVKYQRLYGDDEYYAGMMSYLDMMSKEIAAMQKFGPNPDFVMERMMAHAKQVDAKGPSSLSNPQHTYDDLMGKTYANRNRLSSVAQTFRNVEYMRKLSYSAISATTDANFIALTSTVNSIPILKVYKRMLKNLGPNDADRHLALKLGIMSDYAMDRSAQAFRYAESVGLGWSSKFADATVRATGLNNWTVAGKTAFGLEFLSAMSDAFKVGKVKTNMKKAFARYNINAEDLKVLAASKRHNQKGIDFIDPQNLELDLRKKVVGMVAAETQFAVPEPNARVRGMVHWGTKGGTVPGELMRMFGQLKTFPITMMSTHIARMVNMSGTSALGYAAHLMIGGMIFGALAQQGYELAKGKTPMDWGSKQLWLRGLDRSGSFGILGDAITASARSGNALADWGIGPVFQTTGDLATLVVGSAAGVTELEKTWRERSLPQLGKLGTSLIPGQTWWNRLALDRFVFDYAHRYTNPNFYTQQKRIRSNFVDTGQTDWWGPE